MTLSSMLLPEDIQRYLQAVSVREPESLRRLRRETARLAQAHYQIAPEQGQFLTFLLEVMDARRVLDIGTFTGYSALAAALALPLDGRVVTCDVSREWTDIARRHWQEAGVAGRIELRLGPAAETLETLRHEGWTERFDVAVIDADKEGYRTYYEACLVLVRPGGVIAIDNTLWRGRVADPAADRGKTRILRAFNDFLHGDARVTLTLLPLGDGLTLARKRPC